jgi:hypothetical protein
VSHSPDDRWGEWSAAFTPYARRCTVNVEDPEKCLTEMHQWTISDAGEMTELENETIQNTMSPPASVRESPTKVLLLDGQYSCRHAVRRS